MRGGNNQRQNIVWVMVEKINQQIDLLDKRADELLIIFKSTANPGFLTSLENVAKGLLPILFPGINSINDIEAERSRLKVEFATEYNSLPADTGDIYIDTILVLETAASLGHRDKMKILGITASDSELSGADLFSFGGFFDFKYRKHDYDVGRKKAQDFLTNPACPLGKLNFIAEPVDPIDASLNGLTIDKMDEGIRKNFYGHLKTQVLDTMSKAGMGYIKRTAIYEIIIGPRLKKILKL